jgi:polysaccharide pyruvyl transferase WcaK-like protein
MNIIITGYYSKDNFGDDLFELIADKLFQSDKFKKQINTYEIIPITNLIDTCTCINNDDGNIPDCIILFGGETLNDFFLDKLITIYEYYKSRNVQKKHIKANNNATNNNAYKQCLFKAFSVSCNQEYNVNLINKLQLFDTIYFRSKKDYNFFNYRMIFSMTSCEYIPDIVFTLNFDKIIKIPHLNKYVGFFLSQTAYYSLNETDKSTYITTIVNYINYWINKKYNIKLFSMCTNDIESENDNIINEIVYKKVCDNLLNTTNTTNTNNTNNTTNTTNTTNTNIIKHYKSNKDILSKFSKLSFTVCWRYHAHILSIIHNTPFISISNTPKVIDLLDSNNLDYYKANPNTYEEKVNYLIINNIGIKKQLKTIYKANNKLTHRYLNPLIYTSYNKYNNAFYINENQINIIINYIISNYTSKRSNISNNLDKANYIIFLLMRNINNEYTYGLESKIANGIDNSVGEFKKDIEWLIYDCIFKTNILFYESARQIIKHYENNNNNNYIENIHNPNALVNIKYILQDDYVGFHRSGWSYVVNNLNSYHDNNKIVCDLYLDRTFHWKCGDFTKLSVIPYTKPWIGFIHHTLKEDYSENNTVNLFKNPQFLISLQNCKGLYVLSKTLKEQLLILINTVNMDKSYIPIFPVYTLTHPTEIVSNDKLFTMDNFIKNESRHIIQIGAWLRNLNAINILDLGNNNLSNLSNSNYSNNLKLTKAVLKGKEMDSYYAGFDKSRAQTEDAGFDKSRAQTLERLKPLSKEFTIDTSPNDVTICRDKNTKAVHLDDDIKVIKYLENNDYDLFLMKNIVFINLIDASAVNTIIECIVRNTPIFVNRLPATEEALGRSYPLFYNEISDVTNMLNINKITEGYNYLCKMNKDKFKIETFINELKQILVNI